MRLASIVLLLSACNATTAEVKDVGDDDDDTATETIVGDDDDDDTTTATPYETPDPTWFLSGSLHVPIGADVPVGDVQVVLISLNGDFQFGEVFRQVDVGPITADRSVDYEIGLADEVGDEWYNSDAMNPGMEVALFALGAYIDEDGDGEATTTDTYVSASQDPFVASIRGILGTDAGGALLGWNHVSNEIVTPFTGDRGGVDIDANLLPIPPTDPLSCEIIPALDQGPPGVRRVDLYSFTGWYDGAFPADPSLVSVGVPNDQPHHVFDFPDLGVPPDDHFTDDLGDGPTEGLLIAAYVAVAYVDTDGNGAWSGNGYVETPLASNDSMAYGVPARTVMYLRATGWGAGYVAPYFGGLGWVLFEDDPYDPYGDITPLDFSDGLLLDDEYLP